MHPVALDGLAALDADARGAAEWALDGRRRWQGWRRRDRRRGRRARRQSARRRRPGERDDAVLVPVRQHGRWPGDGRSARWLRSRRLPDGSGEVDSEATVHAPARAGDLDAAARRHRDVDLGRRALAGRAERLGRRDLQARALVDLGISQEQMCRPAEASSCSIAPRCSRGRRARLGSRRWPRPTRRSAYFDIGAIAEAIELGWRSLANRAGLGDRWAGMHRPDQPAGRAADG